MAKAKTRVKVPKSVKKGEVFEAKALIKHKMETGQRKDRKTGEKVPRFIINKFTAEYNGKQVFASDWHPAIAANPFISFHAKASESGTMVFKWTDDKGKTVEASAKVNVA